jgi:hypothetical protein
LPEATARIWPELSYVFHIRSLTVFYVPHSLEARNLSCALGVVHERLGRARAKRGRPKRSQGLLPEILDQTLALTVLYVPHSLETEGS